MGIPIQKMPAQFKYNHQEAAALWKKYAVSKDLKTRNRLAELNMPLVYKIANQIAQNHDVVIKYSQLEFGDLVGYGVKGLFDAIDKFITSKNLTFSTYAEIRIHGEILSGIVSYRPGAQRLHYDLSKLEKTINNLASKLGRRPCAEEIAVALNTTKEKVEQKLVALKNRDHISLDQKMPSSSARYGNAIATEITKNSHWENELVEKTIPVCLTKKEQLVMTLALTGMAQKEIAQDVNMSTSNVSRTLDKATVKLRVSLKNNHSSQKRKKRRPAAQAVVIDQPAFGVTNIAKQGNRTHDHMIKKIKKYLSQRSER